METTFDPSLYGAPSLGRTVCIYMQWPPIYAMAANIYMQRSPMCVIDLYVLAANKLYMQWPPMCAMGANISMARIFNG